MKTILDRFILKTLILMLFIVFRASKFALRATKIKILVILMALLGHLPKKLVWSPALTLVFCLACEADARRRRRNFPAAAVGAAVDSCVVNTWRLKFSSLHFEVKLLVLKSSECSFLIIPI